MGDDTRRFDIFFEDHIGVGFRWLIGSNYPFMLSFAIPFITITIGFGRKINFID